MKRLIFLYLILSVTFLPLSADYYSYKKGSKWQDFYGYHGWKSVYRYEGWKSVYKYNNWRDVYGYYGWREVYLREGSLYHHPLRSRDFYQRGRVVPILFFRGFIFCIPEKKEVY